MTEYDASRISFVKTEYVCSSIDSLLCCFQLNLHPSIIIGTPWSHEKVGETSFMRSFDFESWFEMF